VPFSCSKRSEITGNILLTTGSGNVGVGAQIPAAKLHVRGDTKVDGPLSLAADESALAARDNVVAEWVPYSHSIEQLEPGTVVTMDPTLGGVITAAARAYDPSVFGVVARDPAVTIGWGPQPRNAPIAHSGRVVVKADATFGPIRPGDLLVTSPEQGHAMRASDELIRPGTVIGKALSALPEGRGEILALLMN
jgi:hypothetical protein